MRNGRLQRGRLQRGERLEAVVFGVSREFARRKRLGRMHGRLASGEKVGHDCPVRMRIIQLEIRYEAKNGYSPVQRSDSLDHGCPYCPAWVFPHRRREFAEYKVQRESESPNPSHSLQKSQTMIWLTHKSMRWLLSLSASCSIDVQSERGAVIEQ